MKASKSPAFQFYPADYLSSQKVETMSLEHQGAYVRLLCYDWLNDGIPDDQAALAKLSRLGESWDKGGYTLVKACFNQHVTKPGFLTNPRLQAEREKQASWRDKSSEGGKKAAITRWGKGKRNKDKGGYKMVKECLPPNDNSSSSSSSSNSIMGIPTIEEVKLQAAKIGLPDIEAEKFFNYYSDRDWMRGKNKLKRWTGALANWKINWQGFGGTKPPPQSNGGRPDWAC